MPASSDGALADLVRRYRRAAGLTQAELAVRARLSIRMIRNLESGLTRHPHRESVRLLSDALRLDAAAHEQLHAAIARPGSAGGSVDHPQGTPSVVPAMLPTVTAHFAGRQAELTELDGLAAAAASATGTSVAAIVGPGGIGKTSLAVWWARTAAERFPDGQLFVDLRGFHARRVLGPEQALARLLFALGVSNDRVPTDVDDAVALYRSVLHGRRMLVVLDNVRSVDQVRPLLPAGPGCFTLVTSRDRLTGLIVEASAHRLALAPLPVPAGAWLVARIVGRDRVDADPAAVRDLVAVCDGLPLALSIASANLADRPELSIAAYVRELRAGDQLVDIRAGHDGPALLPAFELTYSMLSEQARTVFRRVGVVPCADFTADAVAAPCGMPVADARAHLERLVDTHLVQSHHPGRYTVHDLLRRYARQIADETDIAATDALLAYFIRWSRAAAELLYPQMLRLPLADTGGGPDSADDARAWLAAEIHNLVAACLHAAEHGPHEAAWLIADALRGYFWHRHQATDWQLTATAAARAAEQADDTRARAAMQINLAHLRFLLRNPEASMRHWSAAVRLARQAGWGAAESTATANLATDHSERGNYREAVGLWRNALALHRAAGFRFGEATVLGNYGYAESLLGNLDSALDLLRQALAVHTELGSAAGQGVVLANLSGVEIDVGRFADAERHAHDALALARQSGRMDTEVIALTNLSTLHLARAETDAALDMAREAVDSTAQLDGDTLRAEAMTALALARSGAGDQDGAATDLHAALRLARPLGHPVLVVKALLGLATVERRRGGEARTLLIEAATLADRHGFELLRRRATELAATAG
ncbi:MAG TPA: tetratricopeptide repeat protein [Pseudonocardiaceae bacterium]|nr:tetratricopeptide repeat protein [Pseudonocardiaceae bacterium]